MGYNILIIKNRYPKKLDFKKYLDWFKEHTPIEIKTEEIQTDFDFGFQKVGNATYTGYIPDNSIYSKIQMVVPRFKYHAVVLVYGNNAPGIRVSSANGIPLYKETELITLSMTNDKGLTLNHELFHTFFKRLERKGINIQDPMDTYINNRSTTIDKVVNTNREQALQLLTPYWEKVCSFEEPKYIYFKESEVVGLKPEFVQLLDKIRGECGFPFIINSGFRSTSYNKEIGGVENSAHIQGLAVDIKCITSEQRFKIINSAISNGITRIGIAKTYAHLDIDQTKPSGVVWLYD